MKKWIPKEMEKLVGGTDMREQRYPNNYRWVALNRTPIKPFYRENRTCFRWIFSLRIKNLVR